MTVLPNRLIAATLCLLGISAAVVAQTAPSPTSWKRSGERFLSIHTGGKGEVPRLADADGQPTYAFNLPQQALADALRAIGRQTAMNILFEPGTVENLTAPEVRGTLSAEEAVKRVLKGTKLIIEQTAANSILISSAGFRSSTSSNSPSNVLEGAGRGPSHSQGEGKGEVRLVRDDEQGMKKVENSENQSVEKAVKPDQSSSGSSIKGIPEILVKGKRSLNTDIERTEDAPQPYVVFENEEIQRSQAVNLEEFLRTRLPMNTASSSIGQTTGNSYTLSQINLRGLGANQTLILIDGRRMPSVASSGSPLQPDLNGVPLAAVERIEVLPSTASGIYGGSATGGAINVILRRDFQGLDAKATYINTFDTDVANVRLDLNAGISLEGGRTQLMIAATRSMGNNLVIGDRDFAARAVALQLANNPDAITGSGVPPLGATVNILSANVVNQIRQPLVLDGAYGGAALGATTTHLPLGYAGPASDGGAALVVNAGQYNLELPGGLLGKERGLVAAPSMASVSLNLRREFGKRLEAFLDVSQLGNEGSSFTATNIPNFVSNLPADAPNNPFQQAISIRFPTPGLSFESRVESTTIHATGGLIARLSTDWTGEIDYGWSRSRLQRTSAFRTVDSVGSCVLERGVAASVDPDGAGQLGPCAVNDSRPALNALQDGNLLPLDFTPYLLPSPNYFQGPYDTVMKDVTVRFSGPVATLPGGPLNLSTLISRREEEIQDAFDQRIDFVSRSPTYNFIPHRSQEAASWYLEARAPLVGGDNALCFARELELQLSVRHDRYTTESDGSLGFTLPSRDAPRPELNYTTNRMDSTDYTIGLRFSPLQGLTLRASFGTGFLPPTVTQIAPVLNFGLSFPLLGFLGLTDPMRGDSPIASGDIISNGSPNLAPEKSRSWSAGLVVVPQFESGFRLSVDYTRIEKVDEVQFPNEQFLLDNEEAFPGRIIRGANLPGDPASWPGLITTLDATYINIARTTVEAYDVQADISRETQRFGAFHWYLIATRQTHYNNRVLPGSPMVDSAGFTGGPLEWRGNLGLSWSGGPWSLSWNAQYYDSYLAYSATASPISVATAILNQGSATIPSQTYHDVVAAYRFDAATSAGWGLLADSEISVGIQNLFNSSPPILASIEPSSAGYSTYGDPRLRRYSISIRKSFGH